MKKIGGVLVLLLLTACVDPSAREASCACFSTEGEPTENCDFTPVSGPPENLSFLSTKSPDQKGPC